MPAVCRYQAVILDPEDSGYGRTLRETFTQRCAELGLALNQNVVILDEKNYDKYFNKRAPAAAVYYGIGRSGACTIVAEKMREGAIPILPAVLDLNQCKYNLPTVLKRLNAHQIDIHDKCQDEAASWLMEELGLIKKQRLVFISYRREDSVGVAQQLDRALDARLFQVFLDTHSIRRGALFQDVIGDRMSDADLMIFLDTPGALSSRWVAEELSIAHNLGLGVFHITWPEHKPYRELELSKRYSLTLDSFRDGRAKPGHNAMLTDETVGTIVAEIESFRAQAFAARRTRVITSLHRQAEEFGISSIVRPDRYVEMQVNGQPALSVYPVVGQPSTQLMEKVHRESNSDIQASLVYDHYGIIDATAQHLQWLNEHVPVKTVPLTEVGQWLSKQIRR